MTTKTEDLNELRVKLEDLSLQEVRAKAKRNFGISVTREHSKDEIIGLIIAESTKFDFAHEADGELKPGWSRIRLHPTPGRSRFPIYVNVNGRSFCIPVNVDVDVPNKIVGVLKDAVELIPRLEEINGIEQIAGFTENLSYPFSLLEQKIGPDPRPGYEVQREAKIKEKRKFEEEHKYWPSDAMMAQNRQLVLIRGN